MAPDTRPPLSHLRPTLSTRLRRSFEGKRSKTNETTTSNGSSNGSPGLGIDPEVLRNAVEQAIMGESFQKAIAANLANIVKPAIKSALDTIQPVVEAVYSHDVLLRKTNKSVERLLDNMDTIVEEDEGRPHVERSASAGSFYDMEFKALLEKSNKRTVATLAELSNAVQSNNSKIASLETSFAQMKENTTSLFSTHGNKLDLMALYITELKDHSELTEKLESVSGELNGLRASVDAGTGMNNGGFVELGAKLDSIVSTTETQAGALDAIKHSTAKTEILAAIQKSHEYHDGRSRARSLINASANTTTADNSSVLQEIKTYLESHSTVLGEIKERSLVAPIDVTADDTSVALQEIKTFLESHSALLGELKERPTYVAPESSGEDNIALLQDIKSHLDSHSTALGEIKERSVLPETVDASPEASLPFQDIKLHLESHSTALDELKERSFALPAFDTTGIITALDAVKTELESHSALLGEIKEGPSVTTSMDVSSTEIPASLEAIKTQLESLKEIIETGHGSNSEVVSGLGSKIDNILVTIDGHKATDASDEILAALQKSNASHDSHATALDGMKSLVVVPPPTSDPVDLTGVESQLSTIVSTLESHTTTLSELRTNAAAPTTEVAPPVSDDTLNLEFKSISTTLETHTKLLNEIKDNVSAEILTALHDMGQTQTLHTATLAELRDADMSDEILTALHTSNEAHTGHQADLEKLHESVRGFDEKYEKHGVDLSEIKTRSLDVPVAVPEGSSIGDLEAKIGGIVSILEEQNATLSSIKGSTESAVESHSAHALSFGQLQSRSLQTPLPVAEKLDTSELEAKVAGIVTILDEQNAALSSIKEATQSALDSHSAHTLTLGEIHSRALESPSASIVEGVMNAELEAKIAGIVTILEEQNSELSLIKQSTQSALDSHSAHALSLSEFKSRSLESPAPLEGTSISDLEAKIASMAETLEQQKSTLADIHTTTTSALESHASHTLSLDEIKSRSLEVPASDHAALLDAKIDGIVGVLEQQKSTLSEIYTSANSAVESHATHALSLDEIKTRSLEPVTATAEPPILQELESKIVSIISILEEQTVALSTLKESTSAGINSHTSYFDEIKTHAVAQRDLHDSHAAVLSEIKDATFANKELHNAHSATLADLVIATSAANDSHASHAVTLAELKAIPPTPATDLSGLAIIETALKSILETLSTHTNSLSYISTSSSTVNPELLASIRESHELLSTHTVLLDSIKTSSSTSHEELLTNLTGLKSTLEDTNSNISSHTSVLSEINTLVSTSNPDILASVKGSNDLLSTHTTLLESIKSSSSTSHEEVLNNLGRVHATLETTKSDISTHGSLVKDLHDETKDSHSSLTTAISALALGGVAGAGVGFLASRNNDAKKIEDTPESVVERAVTPPLVEEKEIEPAPEQAEEAVVERSPTPTPIEDAVSEEVDDNIVPRAITPPLDAKIEPESSSLTEELEDSVVDCLATPPTEEEIPTPEATNEVNMDMANTPLPSAELEPESTLPLEAELIVDSSDTPLALEEQEENASRSINEDKIASDGLSPPIQVTEADLETNSSANEISEPVEESLTPEEEKEIESVPVAEETDLSAIQNTEEEIEPPTIEPILEEQAIENISSPELSEPAVERSLTPGAIEQPESDSVVERVALLSSSPEEHAVELPLTKPVDEETEALPADLMDGEPSAERSITPVKEQQELEILLPSIETKDIVAVPTTSPTHEDHDVQIEEPIANETIEIQDNSEERSITPNGENTIQASSQHDEDLPVKRSITPIQEDQDAESVAFVNELEPERSVTSPDHDITATDNQPVATSIERSVTPVEHDEVHPSDLTDEAIAESIEPVSQEDSILSSLPIADEFATDVHDDTELPVVESAIVENNESRNDNSLDEASETAIGETMTEIDEPSNPDPVPVEEALESQTPDETPLDQPEIESSVIESGEAEIVPLLEESRELAIEMSPVSIEDDTNSQSLPISDETDLSQNQVSLDLSNEPVISAETAENEEVVERDITVHHHVTILPPIVVEVNTKQETILAPEFVESSDQTSTPAAVPELDDGPSDERGVSPEPIISPKAEEDDGLPSSGNEIVNGHDSDHSAEHVDDELTPDLDTTLPTTTVTEIFDNDDDESSPAPEIDESASHTLPVEIDSSSTLEKLIDTPLTVESISEQTSSSIETEDSTIYDANVPHITEQASQSSDSIELAEQIDRTVPDLHDDQNSEKAASDASSETTAIQDPIELVEQIDSTIPDFDENTGDTMDAHVPNSSSESVIAQIVAQFESQAAAKETSLQESSPSSPKQQDDLANEETAPVINTDNEYSLGTRDIDSQQMSPPIETQRAEADTPFANPLHDVDAPQQDKATDQAPAFAAEDSGVTQPGSPLVHDNQKELSKEVVHDSEISNDEISLPSSKVDEQPSSPSQTPGVEHNIFDSYLTPEPESDTLDSALDKNEPIIDSEHAVTRAADRDDDVMSVLSSDDVVSPSEWMFRSSGTKSRNFSPSQYVESNAQNLDTEEASHAEVRPSSDHGASTPLASVQQNEDGVNQDYFPTVTSILEKPKQSNDDTLDFESKEDDSLPERQAAIDSLPELHETFSLDSKSQGEVSSPVISQTLPAEDRSHSPSIKNEDEAGNRTVNLLGEENDVYDHDLNQREKTLIATPPHDNPFAFDFSHAAEPSNIEHSQAEETLPVFDETSREMDQSPLLSPAYTESVYSVMNELVGAPDEHQARDVASSFASPVDERLDFGLNGHHDSSDIKPPSPIAENFPLHSQARLEDLSPLGDEDDDAFDFDDQTVLPAPLAANNQSHIPSSSPIMESIPVQTTRLEDLSPLGDEAFDFEHEGSVDLPAHLSSNDTPLHHPTQDLDSSPFLSPVRDDTLCFRDAEPLDLPARAVESDLTAPVARDEEFSPVLSSIQREAFDHDEEPLRLSPPGSDNDTLHQQTTRELSSSPVRTPVDERELQHGTISPAQSTRSLEYSPVPSPVDDHFEHTRLNAQKDSEAAPTVQDALDERYKRPSSADPYDDEDMVVEWSGKDNENTVNVPAVAHQPVETHENTPSKEINPALSTFEEAPNSPPNLPSSPVLEPHHPTPSETAPEKPNVFQYMDYESDTAEAFSPIATSKGKEADYTSPSPPAPRRRTTEEELAAWMPVDLDKRYSQVPESVPDYFASAKNGNGEGVGEEILSPGLPEQTDSEPTTPATPGFGAEPLSPASVAKKAAGKKKKGKKGKK